MNTAYDFLILGSGSTAFAAAIKANELGARVGMVERRTVGGTCANRGCLPSKNLIEAARDVWLASHPRYRGLAPADVAVDFGALIGQKDDVVHDYRESRYATLARGTWDVLIGDARFVDGHTVSVDGRAVTGDRLLIATGSRPTIPPISGLDTVPYLTSDLLDADEQGRLTELPASMIVLGGGYIALELAQMFRRLGSEITIVARSSLLSNYEPEFGATIGEVLRREGAEVVTDARVERVARNGQGVKVEIGGARRVAHADRLLVATGRTPNTEGLALEKAGVLPDRDGYVQVDAELRTAQPHIWAAGDVVGRQHGSQMATPAGARQGRIVAENAFADARRRFDGSVLPRAIFVDPPIATVGLTEAQVTARHLPAVSATTPLKYVPRAGAIHRPEGFVKMIASTIDERILGVHMIGEAAHEVIHEAAMAMKFRATINDFVDLVHVYPTMSEALKIGAQAFSKDVSKLSCCAE